MTGCHENHAFSRGANKFIFEDNFVLYLGGPYDQFGIHENISCVGARLAKLDALVKYFSKFLEMKW